jgi:hypothetical protein
VVARRAERPLLKACLGLVLGDQRRFQNTSRVN